MPRTNNINTKENREKWANLFWKLWAIHRSDPKTPKIFRLMTLITDHEQFIGTRPTHPGIKADVNEVPQP